MGKKPVIQFNQVWPVLSKVIVFSKIKYIYIWMSMGAKVIQFTQVCPV